MANIRVVGVGAGISLRRTHHNVLSQLQRGPDSGCVGCHRQRLFAAANVASANIYREDDAPLYHRGNSQLIIIAFAQLVQITLAIFYYRWRNARRDKIWSAMSVEERHEYVLNTKDSGNKRLDFRFSY